MDQRNKAHDEWRQRAFFDSAPMARAASQPPAIVFKRAPATSFNFGEWLEKDTRRKRAEKLEREARAEAERNASIERRAANYSELRRQAGNRAPLIEPPLFKDSADYDRWYLAQVRHAPDDPYVNWAAAFVAMLGTNPDATLKDARVWLQRSDPSWPEVKAMLGRLLLLGEGGPADVPRGIKLLLEAEPALRDQPIHARGRESVYYALGRAYAEGLGVPVDEVEALRAFDENTDGKHIYRTTGEYLDFVFWRKRSDRAAEIVRIVEPLKSDWNYSPYSSLSRAAQLGTSPEEKAAMQKRDGMITVLPIDLTGQPELQRQLFLANGVYEDRSNETDAKAALERLEPLVARGLTTLTSERLMPDRWGHFFRPTSIEQATSWLNRGKQALDDLAEKGDRRARAAEVGCALGLWNEQIDEHAAVAWAEKTLEAGSAWGCLYLGWYLSSRDAAKAGEWFNRAATATSGAEEAAAIAKAFTEPPFAAKPDPIAAAQWLEKGTRHGEIESVYATADMLRKKLSPTLKQADQNAAVWIEIETMFRLARDRAQRPWQREAIDHALSFLPQQQAQFTAHSAQLDRETRELRESVAREAEADFKNEEERVQLLLLSPAVAHLDQDLEAALRSFETAASQAGFKPLWGGPPMDNGEFVDAEVTELKKLEFRAEPDALRLAALHGVKVASQGYLYLGFDALDCLKRAESKSERVNDWRRRLVAVCESWVARGQAEAALELAEQGSSDDDDHPTVEGVIFKLHWYRTAATMGIERAIPPLLRLANQFTETVPLYARLSATYQRHLDDEVPLPAYAERLAMLPSDSVERAALTER